MIRFLLHGGVTSPQTEKNKEYFQRIVREGGSKILIFPFAQKDKQYQLQFDIDKKKFENYNADVELAIIQADVDIITLVQQIKETEVLYFCGGITSQHIDVLSQIQNLKELLGNKLITGNSAGSLMWSKYYYTGDFLEVRNGLGLLDIKMICHRKSEKYPQCNLSSVEMLQKYGESLPIICTREQEFVEFYI